MARTAAENRYVPRFRTTVEPAFYLKHRAEINEHCFSEGFGYTLVYHLGGEFSGTLTGQILFEKPGESTKFNKFIKTLKEYNA